MTMNKHLIRDNVVTTALRNTARVLRSRRIDTVSNMQVCVDTAGLVWVSYLDDLGESQPVPLYVFAAWVEQAFDAEVAIAWARERASYHRHQEHLVGSDDEGDEHDFIVIAP